MAGLVDVNTIVVGDETQIFEWRRSFIGLLKFPADDSKDLAGEGFRRGGKAKVVDLTEKEHFGVVKCGSVNAAIVSGSREDKLRGGKNGIDIVFPKTTAFGVALKCM